HYDHGGGLSRFLELNRTAPVYLSPRAFEAHYNGTSKYIGLDTSLFGHKRLVTASYPMRICGGLTLYGGDDIERAHDLGSFGLTAEKDGELVPDDFGHEQYLMIEENGKRVLLSGCSHRGIIDIAAHFRPDVIVGGFHYSKLPTDDVLTGYARLLDSFGIEYYTCHCTGREQFEHMRKHMKSLHYVSAGGCIVL
nr:MBL fold metallo-hydrolase [Clostridia bacterium]